MAQCVILVAYKADSGSVNGDQDGKQVALTRLSSGRRVSTILLTAFVSEVVAMVFDVTSHACDCLLWQGGRYVLPLQHHRYHCRSREVLGGQDASQLGNEAANYEVTARSIL